jgi:hypothetical protein
LELIILITIDKQEEIYELVAYLVKYKPTKVAVEWDINRKNELYKEYLRYQNGILPSNTNEIYQIAFRIANHLNHTNIYPVDWKNNQNELSKLFRLIRKNIVKYPDLLNSTMRFQELEGKLLQSKSILNTFIEINNKQKIKSLEDIYISFCKVKEKDRNIGLEFLINWMVRDLYIFNHIKNLQSLSDEKILLLIGRDHLWMLSRLFREAGWGIIYPFE